MRSKRMRVSCSMCTRARAEVDVDAAVLAALEHLALGQRAALHRGVADAQLEVRARGCAIGTARSPANT